jgi:hypothetical protein
MAIENIAETRKDLQTKTDAQAYDAIVKLRDRVQLPDGDVLLQGLEDYIKRKKR